MRGRGGGGICFSPDHTTNKATSIHWRERSEGIERGQADQMRRETMGMEEGQTSSLDQKGDVTIEGSHSPSPQGTLPLSLTRKQSPLMTPSLHLVWKCSLFPLYLLLLSLPIHPREMEEKKKQWVGGNRVERKTLETREVRSE